MKARIGVAPIAWSNDDLPELGGDTSLETCLSEARRAGYSGIETGGKFPRTPRELAPLLHSHDLVLCGGWYSGRLLEYDLSAEKDRIAEQMHLFLTLNAPCLVYGEMVGAIQNRRDIPLNRRPRLDSEQIRCYGHKLTEFAEWCHDQGMPIAYHHHMGAPIESESDLDLLMNHSGSALVLAFDCGHITFAGGDPVRVIRRHGARIFHFHAKDVRMGVLRDFDCNVQSFLDAVLRGIFTTPGDGDLDFSTMIRALADCGYEGWFVVEAEQDPAQASPYAYACGGFNTLVSALTDSGYTIMEG